MSLYTSVLNREVGFRVRALREKKGLEQKKLSEISGVPQSTLSSFESSSGKKAIQTLMKFVHSLGANLSDFTQITTQEFDEKFQVLREEAPHPLLATIFEGIPTPPSIVHGYWLQEPCN